MTRRRTITPDQIATAIDMRENKGQSLRTIAATIGVSLGSIQWQFFRAGVDTPPKFRKSSPSADRPLEYVRNGRVVRRFSPDQDRMIESMSLDGKGITEIGRALTPPRHAHTIATRLLFLARRDARADGD